MHSLVLLVGNGEQVRSMKQAQAAIAAITMAAVAKRMLGEARRQLFTADVITAPPTIAEPQVVPLTQFTLCSAIPGRLVGTNMLGINLVTSTKVDSTTRV